MPTVLQQEICEFFECEINKRDRITLGEGSLEESHVENFDLLQYQNNSTCSLASIDSIESVIQLLGRRHEGLFSSDVFGSIAVVYQILYPSATFDHTPMRYDNYCRLKVLMNLLFLEEQKAANHLLCVPIG